MPCGESPKTQRTSGQMLAHSLSPSGTHCLGHPGLSSRESHRARYVCGLFLLACSSSLSQLCSEDIRTRLTWFASDLAMSSLGTPGHLKTL